MEITKEVRDLLTWIVTLETAYNCASCAIIDFLSDSTTGKRGKRQLVNIVQTIEITWSTRPTEVISDFIQQLEAK